MTAQNNSLYFRYDCEAKQSRSDLIGFKGNDKGSGFALLLAQQCVMVKVNYTIRSLITMAAKIKTRKLLDKKRKGLHVSQT